MDNIELENNFAFQKSTRKHSPTNSRHKIKSKNYLKKYFMNKKNRYPPSRDYFSISNDFETAIQNINSLNTPDGIFFNQTTGGGLYDATFVWCFPSSALSRNKQVIFAVNCHILQNEDCRKAIFGSVWWGPSSSKYSGELNPIGGKSLDIIKSLRPLINTVVSVIEDPTILIGKHYFMFNREKWLYLHEINQEISIEGRPILHARAQTLLRHICNDPLPQLSQAYKR
jgi:hypothetical protein